MLPLAPIGITALIFGGCCSNVYALEAIVKREPDSGLLITLGQFILTVLATFPAQFDPSQPYFLKRSSVPLYKWCMSAAMFFAVNMLNNWAFAFNIAVPVHIVLRSFGSASTMAAGWLRGKRYSTLQVFSVALLTVGVIVSARADAAGKGKLVSTKGINFSDASFEAGLVILLVAQLLSAYMGVYVQDIYEEHGKHWDENLFYSHFLSIPMFLPLQGTLRGQFNRLAVSPPLRVAGVVTSSLPSSVERLLSTMPESVFMLLLNSVTQLLCISGVNLLSANTTAVTVTIVLNIRKLVSFLISIWLFGNKMSEQMIFGAMLVFGAGALYGWESTVGIKRRQAKANMKEMKSR
ncbi:UAA transporter [Phyllosticta capitalensis]